MTCAMIEKWTSQDWNGSVDGGYDENICRQDNETWRQTVKWNLGKVSLPSLSLVEWSFFLP